MGLRPIERAGEELDSDGRAGCTDREKGGEDGSPSGSGVVWIRRRERRGGTDGRANVELVLICIRTGRSFVLLPPSSNILLWQRACEGN